MNINYNIEDYEANYMNRKINREPWYSGNELVRSLESLNEKQYNKRYIFTDLMDFLCKPSHDICALYGLRRTGKSVLMRQAMRELIEKNVAKPNEIAYITFGRNTDSTDVEIIQDIREKKDVIKYFFIDEISYIKMHLENNLLNLLSDEFATKGIKIVIAGTFSFALKLLSNDVLFDRMQKIDTTYFSFKEAYEVFGYSIEHFTQYGGIIMNPDNKKISPKEYMKTAITDNIVNSLIRSDKLYEIGYLDKKVDRAIGDEKALKLRLTTLIKRVVDNYMKLLIYKDIVKCNYRFSDIGNLAQLIREVRER